MQSDLVTGTGPALHANPTGPQKLRAKSISLSLLVHTAFLCGIIALCRQENPVSPTLVLDLTVALENTVAAKRTESPGSRHIPPQPAAARTAGKTPDTFARILEKPSPPIPVRPPQTKRPAIASPTSKAMARPQNRPDREQAADDRRAAATDRHEKKPAPTVAKEVLQPRPNHGITAREGDLPGAVAAHRKTAEDTEPNAESDGLREKSYLQHNFDLIRSLVMRNLSFPAAARRLGLSGKVLVQFTVQEDGEVADISILSSSGHDHLDANVVSAIHRSAPFPKPTTRARLILPIAYRLK